jgi:CheY-like chemotaxis protein
MSRTKKVLLIEDDANLLYGLQAKLRVRGFTTITDQGLDEAEVLGKITGLKPDYIILDILLPRVDSWCLLKEIKTKPEISRTPIFIFTNLSDDESRQRAKKLGVDVYLAKADFNLDEFIDKFQRIIANKEKIN